MIINKYGMALVDFNICKIHCKDFLNICMYFFFTFAFLYLLLLENSYKLLYFKIKSSIPLIIIIHRDLKVTCNHRSLAIKIFC